MTSTQRNSDPDETARTDATGDRLRGSALLLPGLRAAVPIAVATLVAGYLGHSWSKDQPTTFEATSNIVLSASTNFDPLGGSFGSQDDRYVENQAEIIRTLPVLDRAAAILADGVPGADLRGDITAKPRGASDVIIVTAESGDAVLAARRADAVAAAYQQFTTAEVIALADQAAAAAANALDPTVVLQIRARAATYGDGVAVIQPASVPSEPATPTPVRNALLAAGAALLLSCLAAAGWLRRRRPVGPDRLAADVGGPLMGEVPVRWFGPAAVPQQPGRADYAMALQALRYRMRDVGDQTVLLTSAGHDSSATSALLGLAAADAAQGRTVVIVDATPDGRLLRRAGVPVPAVSLTTAVAGGEDLDRVLGNVPALAGPHGGSVRATRVERTSLESLRKSLMTLRASADLVLVDAGSAVQDPAAFALVGEVGAVVAVVRAKHRGKALGELRRRLALAGRECDGVLVTHRSWVPALNITSSPFASERPQAPAPRPAKVPATVRPDAATESSATASRSG